MQQMSGKSLLEKALCRQSVSRVPWVPYVGVHGGALIGSPADRYLNSSDLICEGLQAACERYRPDGLPVIFDLQIEAEALGCELRWSPDSPPAVVSHPLAGTSDTAVSSFDLSRGRIPMVLEATRRVQASLGSQVCLYGLITGPLTLASHLMGNEVFLALRRDPQRIERVLEQTAQICKQMATGYLEQGADLIAVVDPMTSQISPTHFGAFIQPKLLEIFAHIKAAGGWSSLFVCGDARRNLALMFQSGCDNVSFDENIPLELADTLAAEHGCSFGGNLKLTTVLLLGSRDDVAVDVERCLQHAQSPGTILAPGCDLPYATPPENLEFVADLIHGDVQRSIPVAGTIASMPLLAEQITLPDYAHDPSIWIDVITIDSQTCPPCQYMVTAAEEVAQSMPHSVIVREHKIATPEGIAMQQRLNVEHLPTICIDGQIRFISEIPDRETFTRELESAAQRKSQPLTT
jgi:MtaA/CmuA family methyltransferase